MDRLKCGSVMLEVVRAAGNFFFVVGDLTMNMGDWGRDKKKVEPLSLWQGLPLLGLIDKHR